MNNKHTYNKSTQSTHILAYADDVTRVGIPTDTLKETMKKLMKVGSVMKLRVNMHKTKYM